MIARLLNFEGALGSDMRLQTLKIQQISLKNNLITFNF